MTEPAFQGDLCPACGALPCDWVDNPFADPEAALVHRFASALLAKLRASENKYGWSRAWMRPDWADDLRHHLRIHMDKGDPIDVAAYAAFAWHHGYSTAPCDSGSGSQSEDAGTAAEAEGPQSGGEAASPNTSSPATQGGSDG